MGFMQLRSHKNHKNFTGGAVCFLSYQACIEQVSS